MIVVSVPDRIHRCLIHRTLRLAELLFQTEVDHTHQFIKTRIRIGKPAAALSEQAHGSEKPPAFLNHARSEIDHMPVSDEICATAPRCLHSKACAIAHHS